MIILEVTFLVVFWAWMLSAALLLRRTVPARVPVSRIPEQLNLPVETVRFQATDGIELEGWKICSSSTRPWIVLCPELGSNRSSLLDLAADLYALRFNLFLFDFRAHGASRGWVTSFGSLEQYDLEGALAFLSRQPDMPSKPYGIYGVSTGAATSLMVAARDERLGAIAADDVYASLEGTMRTRLKAYALPSVPFLWFVCVTYRLRFGVWPKRVSPETSAAELGSRPLLAIHGVHSERRRLVTEFFQRYLQQ